MTKIIDTYNEMTRAMDKLEKMYRTYAVRKSRKGQIPQEFTVWLYKNCNKRTVRK
jgi:hypothetical protein